MQDGARSIESSNEKVINDEVRFVDEVLLVLVSVVLLLKNLESLA